MQIYGGIDILQISITHSVVYEDKPILNKLYAYDNFYRRDLFFDGTEIGYDYVLETFVVDDQKKKIPLDEANHYQRTNFPMKQEYRLKPIVRIYNKKEQKFDKQKLKKCLTDFGYYSDIDVSIVRDGDTIMVIDIDDKKSEDFIDNLERNNFRFKVK